ncbi:hypothetical protein [Halalkalibacter hemicellulosilyticus]|uniref:Uncharacterized protein n=1 Tax=Halalkalibacter hemicellulosilyticusJCM 9152 TaxID=1236971 RepID=W4QIY9_9BACI|nr:hypothetical protein [Halalkalibacter hemicellulosilyticus]GAE32085.1 hypothetical protein JCM9152_3601 [Halalkalibacter hemicellulosilyticusJCM 9152]
MAKKDNKYDISEGHLFHYVKHDEFHLIFGGDEQHAIQVCSHCNSRIAVQGLNICGVCYRREHIKRI